MTTSLKLQSPTNVESTQNENKEKEKVTSVDQGNRDVCGESTSYSEPGKEQIFYFLF